MPNDERALYIISVAADLAGVHPQTLRIYERKGLIEPARTEGRSRRYSERDIALLRRIQELTNEGVGLAGVRASSSSRPRRRRHGRDRAARGGQVRKARREVARRRSGSTASTAVTSCPSARPSSGSGAAEHAAHAGPRSDASSSRRSGQRRR